MATCSSDKADAVLDTTPPPFKGGGVVILLKFRRGQT